MLKKYKGSNWSKWDLHVHTPMSLVHHYGGNDNDVWENYITDLENLPKAFKVLGVNDYLFLDGYEKLIECKKNGRLKNIDLLLPIIELRIKAFAGIDFKELQRINLHVIFSEQLTIDDIHSQFLNLIPFNYQVNVDTPWERTGLTRNNVIDFGKYCKGNIPDNKPNLNSDIIEGFNNINVEEESIFRLLNKTCFRGKHFISIGKTEWDNMRWDGSAAEKKHIINKSHFVFTASESIERYSKAKTSLENNNVNNLLIDCSDAHHFSYKIKPDTKEKITNTQKDRIGNSFTWIKADCTFEGLRQIIYEPNNRLLISNENPNTPLHYLSHIILKFPEGTQIIRKEDMTNGLTTDFCIGGSIELSLSPSFTCLIGGRGSGKSTILNLIALKLGENSIFFEQNILRNKDGERISPEKFIEIEGSNESNEIDFVGQSEIESLAHSAELTEKIYDRLKQYSKDIEFDSIVKRLNKIEDYILTHINILKKKRASENELKEKKKELGKFESIISSRNSSTFVEITKNTQYLNDNIQKISHSRVKYEDFKDKLQALFDEFNLPTKIDNLFDNALHEGLITIETILTKQIDFSSEELKLKDFEDNRALEQIKLKDYLKNKGVSEESLNDYEQATHKIPSLKGDIDRITKEIENLNNKVEDFNVHKVKFKEIKQKFEESIESALKPFNDKLKKQNQYVEDIKFEYAFDTNEAKNSLFEEVNSEFIEFRTRRTTQDTLMNCLFIIEPSDQVKYPVKHFMDKLRISFNDSNGKQIIESIFSDEVNYEIYQLLMVKNFINSHKFMRIKGYYGGKELKNCSFGQRCTAVIVALIMLGNKPLIIDEPEAHLDSKLIADYLVNLIKEAKVQRQIIFATHNANFVINGDAELIHILKVGDNNLTNIISTSIEDLSHRSELLELEGGEIAFDKRDKKLKRH
jgi:DNA repair protein SbcC/Rad50